MTGTAPQPLHLDPLLEPVSHRFRCPECGAGPLATQDGRLVCAPCGSGYGTEGGVPILLSTASSAAKDKELGSDTGKAMVAEYEVAAVKRDGGGKRLVDFLRPPDVLFHLNPDLSRPPANRIYEHAGPDTTVLNVGGGPHRYSEHEICLNLNAFFNVNAVGDAHNIPFMDNTFDSVFANAVLEHVYDPPAVIAEMVRVLRPGGYLYAEVPFVFFFHGYPNDFTRYTREGMRHNFRALEDLEIGITNGPVSTWLLNTNVFFQTFLPKRPGWVRKAFNGVYRWTLFPLKYLDIWASHLDDAHCVSGGFYAVGRKAAGPAEEPRS